jgi:tRNA dimethylallyltransferase
MQDINKAYNILQANDKKYADKISPNDSYRIEKWLEIFIQSGQSSSEYFKNNKKQPILEDLTLFEIDIPKDILRQRISLRTNDMLKNGLIDEVTYLEKKYSRTPNSMRSIGIKETLQFLDGFLNKNELVEKITTNTAQLAKRQRTFNSTQFAPHVKGSPKDIYTNIYNFLKQW